MVVGTGNRGIAFEGPVAHRVRLRGTRATAFAIGEETFGRDLGEAGVGTDAVSEEMRELGLRHLGEDVSLEAIFFPPPQQHLVLSAASRKDTEIQGHLAFVVVRVRAIAAGRGDRVVDELVPFDGVAIDLRDSKLEALTERFAETEPGTDVQTERVESGHVKNPSAEEKRVLELGCWTSRQPRITLHKAADPRD